MVGLLEDVRAGLRFVWSHPVLRSISIMMALINFVASTQTSQLVLFANRALGATGTQVALPFAACAAGIIIVSIAAGPIRRQLSFAVTARVASRAGHSACRVRRVRCHDRPLPAA